MIGYERHRLSCSHPSFIHSSVGNRKKKVQTRLLQEFQDFIAALFTTHGRFCVCVLIKSVQKIEMTLYYY
jgi:hypothetical protein